VEDLGHVNLDDEAARRQERYYVPNWFSAEVKTGVGGQYMHAITRSILTTIHSVIVLTSIFLAFE